MSRDTAGKRQPYKFTDKSLKYERPAPTRHNRWGANYEKDIRSKSGTNRPSTRTGIRSRPAALGGRMLVVGGQLIPILGVTYVVNDLISAADGEQSDIIDLKETNEFQIKNISSFGKSVYSSPLGKVVVTIALNKFLPYA